MRISAVILAGGKGERLFPLTNTRPKPLCPVGNVYPLQRAIDLAKEAGAGEIIVTAGHMAKEIEEYTKNIPDVITVREEHPLSTAGAVKNARPSGEIIMVLCGDTLCGFSLLPAVKHQINSDSDITVVTTRSKYPTDYGVVITRNGKIIAFSEKPSWSGVESDEVNTGIYIFRRRVLDKIPEGVPYDFGSQLFPKMVENGDKIGVYASAGYWCDMGNPKTYYLANMAYTGGKNAIAPDAVIEGAAIKSSVIMPKVYIGHGARIKNSIICENVKIGRGCVIDGGCIIGGGTVIDDGCKINSGVVITNGVYVGKGTTVMKNIYTHQFKTHLFDSELGIGGVYGSGFDISDGVYLGQSLCSCVDGQAKIGVMSSSGGFSRILAGVTLGGVRFGGGEAYDLGIGYYTQCAWAARHFGLDYTLYVDVDDNFAINISVFDKSGLFVPRETQRRLERIFFRRGQPKKPKTQSQDEAEILDAYNEYKSELVKNSFELKSSSISVKNDNQPSKLLRDVISEVGGSTDGGNVYDISDDGTRVSVTSPNGETASYWHLWCYVMGEKVKSGMKTVAMPIFSPVSAAEYLTSLGGTVEYYSDSENDNRELAGCLYSETDGCHLAIFAENLMKRENITVGQMLSKLPKFYIREFCVPVDEEEKAERARRLHDSADSCDKCSSFVFSNGRVSVVPSNGAFFKLFAEAVSFEAAEEISLEVKKKISDAKPKQSN